MSSRYHLATGNDRYRAQPELVLEHEHEVLSPDSDIANLKLSTAVPNEVELLNLTQSLTSRTILLACHVGRSLHHS